MLFMKMLVFLKITVHNVAVFKLKVAFTLFSEVDRYGELGYPEDKMLV